MIIAGSDVAKKLEKVNKKLNYNSHRAYVFDHNHTPESEVVGDFDTQIDGAGRSAQDVVLDAVHRFDNSSFSGQVCTKFLLTLIKIMLFLCLCVQSF